jgi:HTH-type transcriptional regulator / antitoxin HigA
MTATATQEYKTLLAEIAPEEVRTEAQNEAALRKIEELTNKGRVTVAERKLIGLLTVLVEAFEEDHYASPDKVTPLEILRELMPANGLKQKDMTDIFGTPSIVSEVLRGKRKLTTEHIRKLSERFHVSTALFFQRPASLGASVLLHRPPQPLKRRLTFVTPIPDSAAIS